MTHPITPREKVARIVDPEAFDHPTVHPQHLVARRAVSFSKADAILTALASDPGDHAELAKAIESLQKAANTEAWHWGVAQDAPDCVDVRVADLRAIMPILAENAALRARIETILDGECACCVLTRAKCADTVAEIEIGRTEAERKLAEAGQVIRDIAETPYTGADWPRERARTFLSKEAERG